MKLQVKPDTAGIKIMNQMKRILSEKVIIIFFFITEKLTICLKNICTYLNVYIY